MPQHKRTVTDIFKRFYKKLNAPYQLSITEMESMEESFSFHLTRKSVYIFLTSVFVIIFMLYSVIIFYTPLKYYIPGMQNNAERRELMKLQNLSDSLIKINKLREGYVFNLLQVVNGDFDEKRDTIPLSPAEIRSAEISNENKIDKASRYDYLKNQKKDSLSLEKKDSLLIHKNQ